MKASKTSQMPPRSTGVMTRAQSRRLRSAGLEYSSPRVNHMDPSALVASDAIRQPAPHELHTITSEPQQPPPPVSSQSTQNIPVLSQPAQVRRRVHGLGAVDRDDSIKFATSDICGEILHKPSAPKSDLSAAEEEYTTCIFQELRLNEQKYRPREDYMEVIQQHITYDMRSILIDWLIEVCEEYSIKSQTLFLAVNFLDRLLSQASVAQSKLQLVGLTALFLASKYEEGDPPALEDFVYIADKTYTRQEVISMERVLLAKLHWTMTAVTPIEFLAHFCTCIGVDRRTTNLAHFIVENFTTDKNYIKFIPSQLATSSLVLALYTLHKPHWSPVLESISGYSLQSLQTPIQALRNSFRAAHMPDNRFIWAKTKYSSPTYGSVGCIQPRL